MPVDISEVKVTFGNGIKREEYGPTKRAEVSLTAIVNTGDDGIIALSVLANLAKAKVREMLLADGAAAPVAPAEDPLPPTSSGSPASPPEAEPTKRTRRTKEQIAADNAAAAGAGSTVEVTQPASEPGPATEAGSPATAAATDPSENEWAAAAPETVAITDQELNHTCSLTSERTKDPLGIKAVIGSYSPGGPAWDPAQGGRKFTVNDIPANQRADFIAKLKAL